MRRRAALAACAAIAPISTLGGCGLLQSPSPVTMDLLLDDRACSDTLAPALVVLLPGTHMTPAELQYQGFIAAVRQRGIAADVVAADAHLGYVQDGSIGRRLRDDVVAPAREQGYRQVWLAGISLGGFVALAYTMRNPGEIAGVVMLGPYLGRRALVQAMIAAGGPAAWRRNAQPRDAQDVEHEVWMWLSALPADAPPLYLGYGGDDRYADAHRLLATLLPADHVRSAPGGHDWPPWHALWAEWLDRGLLPATCAA